MEKNKTIAMVITAAVAIIMVGSLLVPIINDAVDDTKVYYNNEYGPYADVTDGERIEIVATAIEGDSSGGTMTVNGESVIIPYGGRSILISDNLSVAHNYSYGLAVSGWSNVDGFINYGLTSLTMVIQNGSITLSGTNLNSEEVSATVVYDWCYYRSNSGDFRLIDFIDAERVVYFNDYSQIKSANYINTTREFFSLSGTDVKVIDADGNIENITATAEVTDVMNGVYSITVTPDRSSVGAFKFTVDNAGEPYDVFPYYFVIPASVYGQTDTNAAYAGVLAVLPILVICGIMVAVVATFRSKF